MVEGYPPLICIFFKDKKVKCKSHMVSLRSVKKYTWIPLNQCLISIVLSSTIDPIMEIIGK